MRAFRCQGSGRRRQVILPTIAVALLALAACGDDDSADDEPPATGEADALPDPSPAAPEDLVPSDEWAERAEAPLQLTEVGAAAFAGEVWTAGGFDSQATVVTAVQIYDPEADEWRAGPDLPAPVHHASLVATNADLVLLGGYAAGFDDQVTDVLILDGDAEGWVEGPSLPEARGAGAGAWDGERLVYAGGVAPGGALADQIWVLDDLDDGRWTEAGELSVARDHLAATGDGDGTVWFLGGREGTLETNLGTVDMLTGDTVIQAEDLPTPRGGVAAFYSERHGACLAGGEEPTATFSEVECVLPDGTVTTLPPLTVPRHGLGAATIDDTAYVVLGGPEPFLAVSGTVEALSLR